jgi:hypothetical protein
VHGINAVDADARSRMTTPEKDLVRAKTARARKKACVIGQRNRSPKSPFAFVWPCTDALSGVQNCRKSLSVRPSGREVELSCVVYRVPGDVDVGYLASVPKVPCSWEAGFLERVWMHRTKATCSLCCRQRLFDFWREYLMCL